MGILTVKETTDEVGPEVPELMEEMKTQEYNGRPLEVSISCAGASAPKWLASQ